MLLKIFLIRQGRGKFFIKRKRHYRRAFFLLDFLVAAFLADFLEDLVVLALDFLPPKTADQLWAYLSLEPVRNIVMIYLGWDYLKIG